MSPETGRLIEQNSLLIPDQKFLHLLPNQIKILQPQIWLPAGKKGTRKLQQEIVSVDIWTRLTHGGPCNLWVYTYGPSPFIAIDGCLHLDPAQSWLPQHPNFIISTTTTSQNMQWQRCLHPDPAKLLQSSTSLRRSRSRKRKFGK